MKTVFVLLGEYDYEGGSAIGVYSSAEKAEAAVREHEARPNRYAYDGYKVVTLVLDGPAEDSPINVSL